MHFESNQLPSSSKEVQWYWKQCIKENVDFSKVILNGRHTDFTEGRDYFNLTVDSADKISYIGRRFGFFEQEIALEEFEMNIFGDMYADTQIGAILSSVNHLREELTAYGIYATFVSISKSVYCAFTICIAERDTGMEMDVAIIEIGQDEAPYINPIFINEEVLDYYDYDDMAKISYWLANFWLGIQYEMNNCPEEIRVIEQRESIENDEEDYKKRGNIVLVKKIIPIDEEGNEIKYVSTGMGRQYNMPAWRVRGHYRTLPDGRKIYISPHVKGKERDNVDFVVEKEYRFVDDKIESDIK